MTELTIPAGPDEVTSEWLTQALHSTGTISRTRIASFASAAMADHRMGELLPDG